VAGFAGMLDAVMRHESGLNETGGALRSRCAELVVNSGRIVAPLQYWADDKVDNEAAMGTLGALVAQGAAQAQIAMTLLWPLLLDRCERAPGEPDLEFAHLHGLQDCRNKMTGVWARSLLVGVAELSGGLSSEPDLPRTTTGASRERIRAIRQTLLNVQVYLSAYTERCGVDLVLVTTHSVTGRRAAVSPRIVGDA
jgi:hypothetical protein